MMHDVMDNVPEKRIDCLDKGHVTLIDVMPRLAPEGQTTADFAIVQAARVSYGAGTKTVNEDRGLIRYLMRHSHTTPLEMVEFKFCMKLPVFCARQVIRHRMSSVNEYSGRYSVMKDEFYFPDKENVHQQSKTNKQGGDQPVDDKLTNDFIGRLQTVATETYSDYTEFVAWGVAREQARMVLPQNLYTEWYWKIDLHNLLHFLALRCDTHAQWETRQFAEAILTLIKPIVPVAVEAWEDYHDRRGAVKLTRLEIEALKRQIDVLGDSDRLVVPLDSDNKREQAEWLAKAARFGLKPARQT